MRVNVLRVIWILVLGLALCLISFTAGRQAGGDGDRKPETAHHIFTYVLFYHDLESQEYEKMRHEIGIVLLGELQQYDSLPGPEMASYKKTLGEARAIAMAQKKRLVDFRTVVRELKKEATNDIK